MSFVGSNILAGASGQGDSGYKIERSLRFNSADSAYLNRTPSAAGNQKTWTLSFWMKRTTTGSREQILSAAGSHNTYVEFQNDKLMLEDYNPGQNLKLQTTRVFRDPSSWYSVIFSVDTTQATASNRVKLYINGVQETTFDTANYASQNYDTSINDTGEHKFGQFPGNTAFPFNGYLADVHLIDGQALAPTDFGEFDSNNVWQPKEHSFSTNPNNGTTWDSTKTNSYDGATITDAVAGTCTFTGSNGNFTSTLSSNVTVNKHLRLQMYASTTAFDTYCDIQVNGSGEQTVTVHESQGGQAGIYDVDFTGTLSSIKVTAKNGANVGLAQVIVDGYVLINGANNNSFHLDFADNSSNAALGTDTSGNNNTWTVNNLVAAPAGLSTANQGMDVVTYSGNGSTQSISSLAFQPDLIWLKCRNTAYDHRIFDSVRGFDKRLGTNITDAEYSDASISSVNSNGFTLSNTTTTNGSGTTQVAWCWKAGGAASSNTDGTITSLVSANNTYGFSITTWTGDGNNNKSVGHGLSSCLLYTSDAADEP